MGKIIIYTVALSIAHWAFGGTTYVSGFLKRNTTWDSRGSPYVITGDVYVDSGVSLYILPGVKVLFTGGKKLVVKGMLTAIGFESCPIIFTALDTLSPWEQLRFISPVSPCSLKYCEVSYACNSAINNSGWLYIGYSTLTRNSGVLGGAIYNSGTVLIINNTITQNSASFKGGATCNEGSAFIIGNTITQNSGYWGGGVYTSGDIKLTNNKITGNKAGYGGGIYIYSGSATITYNTITGNKVDYGGGGIFNSKGSVSVTDNTIIDTTISTIWNNAYIYLYHNNLNNLRYWGNTFFNTTSDDVTARYNYWFTLDTEVINQKIYDYWDDSTKGKVLYQPFLTEPIGIGEEKILPFRDNSHSILSLYPIPGRSFFHISFPPDIYDIKIYDPSGRMIKELAPSHLSKELKISLKGFRSGVYFLKTNKGVIKFQVVK